MAKIKRLFADWNIPTPDQVDDYSLQAAVESARRISEEVEDMQAILPFEEEARKVDMPQQLRDLLCLMLVPDPDNRPSVSALLKSAELLAFEKFVGV